MCVENGVGIGVRVAVGLSVEVAVPLGLGVNVGIVVGGAVTLNPIVVVAGVKAGLPAKLAVSVAISATDGVSVQDALPLASVVPKQELPSRENWTLAPVTGAGGVTETSLSEPRSVTGFPTATVIGLRLRVRNDECVPVVQLTTAWLEVRVLVPSMADAVIVSTPANRAV